MTSAAAEPEQLELGDFELQSGQVLLRARLAYVTRGKLNTARDNVVVLPTFYTGTHRQNLALVGPGRALDPERYFIVIPNLFGNGVSSSPSSPSSKVSDVEACALSIALSLISSVEACAWSALISCAA